MRREVVKPWRARPAQGLTLVELLVGLAVGLGVVAMALALFTDHARQSRQLLMQARLQHDLQALADLMARELRRAGHAGPAAPDPSPFTEVEITPSGVTYRRDRNGDGKLDGNETLGFALDQGRLRMRVGNAAPQELNDPGVVAVTRLSLSPVTHRLPLADHCHAACTDTQRPCPQPPEVTTRQLDLRLEGALATQPQVHTQVSLTVPLRNPQWWGGCP